MPLSYYAVSKHLMLFWFETTANENRRVYLFNVASHVEVNCNHLFMLLGFVHGRVF
jgi:hypothetical protein